ncbi:MAG: hypothetical protein AB1830_02945 [Pseudomonadota bacterium]
MEQALAFIEQHGLVAVFIAVFLEQVGAPLPALPVLLLAGAMAAGHPAFGVLALGAAIVASTLGDYAWYWAGRRIPGARPVDLEDLERAIRDIPPERDVIVYCTCPNEASAVKVARLLAARDSAGCVPSPGASTREWRRGSPWRP